MTNTKIDFLIKDLWKTVIEYVDGDIDAGLDLDKLDWKLLSRNPSAVYILEKESEEEFSRVYYTDLAYNKSSAAMEILNKNINSLDDEYLSCAGCGSDKKNGVCDDCTDTKTDNGWYILGQNPFAIDIIKKYLNKIDIDSLSFNPSDKVIDILENSDEKMADYIGDLCDNTSERAINLIKTNMDKHINEIDWVSLSINPSAIDIIEKNIDRVDWKGLSLNTSDKAMNIIESNLDKIDWEHLSSNTSTKAVDVIENNLDKANWENLGRNPSAIRIIEKRITHIMSKKKLRQKFFKKNSDNGSTIFWYLVCKNPAAIHIIEKYINKVDWDGVSANPAAIHIIEQNMDKINYGSVSCNKKFFKEYPTIKLCKLLYTGDLDTKYIVRPSKKWFELLFEKKKKEV